MQRKAAIEVFENIPPIQRAACLEKWQASLTKSSKVNPDFVTITIPFKLI